MWSLLAWTLVATSTVLGQTIRDPVKKESYASGRVHMGIMATKESRWAARRTAGEFNSSRFEALAATPCVNGRSGEFKCSNVDLYSFKSHAALGSTTGEGSSSWGWTSATGRDYAIIAQADGAAFAEILSTGELDYVGRLPRTSGAATSIWRELRVAGDLLVVGSEATNHHVQIFDLKKLLTITAAQKPKTFSATTDATTWRGLPTGRTHNIVVNAELKYAVSVGSTPRTHTFRSGLVFIDLTNPTAPALLGYNAADGYVHDAQCLVYRGPDTRYTGHDICYGYNEDTLTIYDVTNKNASTVVSRTSYVGAAYTHQGWVLDPNDQRFLILDDEYDEEDGVGPAADGFPVTYIWNITNLRAPVQTGYYKSSVRGIDHNQYVYKGKAYQSNYGSGLRILDLSTIPSNPSGTGVREVGYFDIYPEDDNASGGGNVDFVGTWSAYAMYASGWILINTIERGAYVVKYTGA